MTYKLKPCQDGGHCQNEYLIEEMRAEIERLRSEKDALRKVVIGMFPMWINAMAYCEHGNRKQLDYMHRYYRGPENKMTNEDLKLMFSIIPEK